MGLSTRQEQVFEHGSARAVCGLGPLALSVVYFGVISQPDFHALDRLVLPHRRAHRVAVERMDRALTLPAPLVVRPQDWPVGLPVSVVVVRDDQYAYSQAFCYALGLIGVNRLTFRVSEMGLALAFVDRLAA